MTKEEERIRRRDRERIRRKEHPEKIRQSNAAYLAAHKDDPAFRERRAESVKRYRERNMEKTRDRSAAWMEKNKGKRVIYSQRWQKKHPRKVLDIRLRGNYGITLEDFESMSRSQSDVCAICKRPERTGRLHVDHCHVDGVVRGLLCGNCNRMLGLAGESTAVLDAAIAYLRSTQKAATLAVAQEI